MANEELLNDEDAIITLTDENGEDVEFELIDSVDYEGKEYLILLPADDEASEVVILEVEPHGDKDETYVTVNDEDTLSAVYEIFKERFKDIFTFETNIIATKVKTITIPVPKSGSNIIKIKNTNITKNIGKTP